MGLGISSPIESVDWRNICFFSCWLVAGVFFHPEILSRDPTFTQDVYLLTSS